MADAGEERSRLRIALACPAPTAGKKPTPPPRDPYAYTMAPVRPALKDAAERQLPTSKTILTEPFHHVGVEQSTSE
jgi:hypothetical protein